MYVKLLILVATLAHRGLSCPAQCTDESQSCPDCPQTWSLHGSACYKILSSGCHGDSAQSRCSDEGQGSNTASIHSNEENYFINHLFGSAGVSDAWIGLGRSGSGFRWSDGTNFGYSNWDSGEPNNDHWWYDEDCVQMYSSGRWVDHHCFVNSNPVCKQSFNKNCPTVQNCDTECCSVPGTESVCTKCKYDYGPNGKAYRRKKHGETTVCEKLCSWRHDSNPCYPGNCYCRSDTCQCAPGFSRSDCTRIVEQPDLMSCEITVAGLHHNSQDQTLVLCKDSSDHSKANFIGFSNLQVNELRVHWHSLYKHSIDFSAYKRPIYVDKFIVGVINAVVNWRILRGPGVKQKEGSETCLNRGMPGQDPVTDTVPCNHSLPISFVFQHADRLEVDSVVTNGGYLSIRSYPDTSARKIPYQGTFTKHRTTVHIDYELPYHCAVNGSETCGFNTFLEVGKHIRKEANVSFKWPGWRDDIMGISGIDYYVYELHKLKGDTRTPLHKEGPDAEKQTLAPNVTFHSTTLTEPGVYAIYIIVYDRANNHQASRKFVLFDDTNKVQLQEGYIIRVQTASQNTTYKWITNLDQQLNLTWHGRFTNYFHHMHGFLNKIDPSNENIIPAYEDITGQPPIRSREAIPNVRGVTAYFVEPRVDHEGGLSILNHTASWIQVDEFQLEQVILNISRIDGESVRFFVKGRDVLGNEAIDDTLVHVDSSPPDLQILGLYRKGERRLAVHSNTDLFDMILEFEAYDDHSGLYTIHWELHDHVNRSRVHGSGTVSTQGTGPMHRPDCEPVGCVCVPTMQLCYPTNYSVSPDKNQMDIPIGVHEFEYIYVVTVTNNAKLVTQHHFKVTVDISPPHPGGVKDNFPQQTDLDFQNHMTHQASWEGFFDKESGVMFYKYGFADTCLSMDSFLHNSTKVIKTSQTWASHNWTLPGTYYCTVVAYNHANDPSEPVCSNGVTIDITAPAISQVVAKGMFTKRGLAKNSGGAVYLMYNDRTLSGLTGPASCGEGALLIDSDMHKVNTYPNGTAVTIHMSDEQCDNTHPARHTQYISTPHKLELSWTVTDIESDMLDCFVGISSTGQGYPTVLQYQSTHAHQHYTIYHTGLSDGQTCYIHIKAQNKAGLEIQKIIGPVVVEAQAFENIITSISVSQEQAKGKRSLLVRWIYNTQDPSKINSIDRVSLAIDNPMKTHLIKFGVVDVNNASVVYCPVTDPPSCSLIPVNDIGWHLHSNHRYRAVLRIHTIAGHYHDYESDWYRYMHGPPESGSAWEASVNHQRFTRDINVSTSQNSVLIRWQGFHHPHASIQYQVTLRNSTDDVIAGSPSLPPGTESYLFTELNLEDFQTYMAEVVAYCEEGETSTRTDGFIVLTENNSSSGIAVHNGLNCIEKDYVEHSGFQISSNMYSACWNIPQNLIGIVKEVQWSMEHYDRETSAWNEMAGTEEILGLESSASRADLHLEENHHYRSAVSLCHEEGCLKPSHSPGFMVLQTAPIPGDITINNIQRNDTLLGINQLEFSWTPFQHPGIVGSRDAILYYSWTVMLDQGASEKHQLLPWQYTNQSQRHVLYKFPGHLNPHQCLTLVLLAKNKVGLKTTVETHFTDCSAVKQPILIDAIGLWDLKTNDVRNVTLRTHDVWKEPDREFTPSGTTLQAVWPSLRHGHYQWKVVSGENINVWDASNPHALLSYHDHPCSSPQVLACGQTNEAFVNIPGLTLTHGVRYYTCIFANETELQFEKFNQILPAVSTCSDGVVVNLHPPKPGRVWIGGGQNHTYQQIDTKSLTVHWENFYGVEKHNNTKGFSGIESYQISVGTFPFGSDALRGLAVGTVTDLVIHNLELKPGQRYFVSVTARDFLGRRTSVTSPGTTIDVSPPDVTGAVDTGGRFHASTHTITLRWHGVFTDQESGITKYLWCVGSRPNHCDVRSYVITQHTEAYLTGYLKIGTQHFFTVKAINGAGLQSRASSPAVTLDDSPPSAGFVLDTTIDDPDTDIDFQTETHELSARWGGFHDKETGIINFVVVIGTCPKCKDLMEDAHWGVGRSLQLQGLHLKPGKRYFTSITACNGAKHCTTVTSDGVLIDYTPPVAGIVFDGIDGTDAHYQISSTRLCAHWASFFDIHSGIAHYEWWAGVTPGGDDVIAVKRLHLSHYACSRVPRHIPLSTKVFITVQATDHAGLTNVATSKGIIVDETAPIVEQKAEFKNQRGSIKPFSQVWRSSIEIQWAFTDAESGINEQYVSLMSRDPSLLHFPTIKLYGDVREYIFANVTLLDGHWYKVKIIGCNGAGLCTQTETGEQLIDNSPPTPGAFAIRTDHAINLERHRHGYMVYNRDVISIAFLGFADPHVGIQDYHVTVGTHYDGADLIPGSTVRVYHYGHEGHRDEGTIERANITLTREVEPQDLLYITIWAVNKVGWTSRRLHGSFVAVPSSPRTGALELNRRCSSWSCQGHCTCSPQDQRCLDVNRCSNVTGFEGYQVLTVMDVDLPAVGSREDKDFTFVTCVMAAAWQPMGSGRTPLRYDWSVGERGAAPGTGLINRAKGVVWRDNGKLTSAVFSINLEKQLAMIPDTVYVFHVRAWYDDVHYGMFSSDGITADNHGLQVSRTAVPREVSRLGSRKDIDVISDTSSVNITWKHVFLTGSTPLSYVTVCIGSTYGNADVIQKHYAPSVTEATITGLDLLERNQYYTTIHAVDMGGLHVSAHSDGFIVDLTKPSTMSADVNDGTGVTDLKYSSTNWTISAHWRGFIDLESALDEYVWCAHSSKGEDILPCVQVGLSLSSKKTLAPENQLIHGETYFSKVQVLDGAGHASDFVESDGFTLDISPPELWGHITGNDLVIDGSFELGIFPRDWTVVDGSAEVWFAGAKDGERSLLIRGTVMHSVPPCACKRAKLTFFTLPLLNGTEEDRVFLGKVKINHVEYLFDIHNDNTSWAKHVYFATSFEDQYFNLSFTGFPFLLDSVSVLPMGQEANASLATVTVHVVPGPFNGVCHVTATWSMHDPESSIKEYKWAVGTVRGGVQLQSFKSVATRNYARLSSVSLTQGSSVHVTIQATNGAGLSSVVYSQPVKVDFTSPEICCVMINGQAGNDTSYVTGYMKVEWLVTDPETSVKLCEWSIGTSPGVSDIKGNAPAVDNQGEANITELAHGEIFYVNIRCENTHGMTRYLSTQEVIMVTGPPHSKNARLATIISSPSVYPARGHHQSVTDSLRLAWSGFQDNSGISHYELHLVHDTKVHRDWITVAVHPVQFCDLTHLALNAYQTYVVSLRAVNHAGYTSKSVSSSFTVETTHPYITGKPLDSYFNPHNTLHVSWNEMFISNSTLMYEVNVGTREGGCDVVCRLETMDSWLTMTNIDSSIQHYISITAVNKAGLATIIGKELNSG